MISFTNDDHPNFHINIEKGAFQIVISLNIEPKMIPFLPKESVFKSEKFHTLVYKSKVEGFISEETILSLANTMMKALQVRCREAKAEALKAEIQSVENKITFKPKQTQFQF